MAPRYFRDTVNILKFFLKIKKREHVTLTEVVGSLLGVLSESKEDKRGDRKSFHFQIL